MYTVYVLHSPDYDKIYVGYTRNLEQRMKSHNELGKKGWTIKYRPWEIIHTKQYETKKQAMNRERELKCGQGREWIRQTLLKG